MESETIKQEIKLFYPEGLRGYMEPANVGLLSHITQGFFKEGEEIQPQVIKPSGEGFKFESVAIIKAWPLFKFLRLLRDFDLNPQFAFNIYNLEIEGKDDIKTLKLTLPLLEGSFGVSVGKYRVNYLYEWMRQFKETELKKLDLTLKWSTDYPMLIELKDQWMLLAPRVEND